jgi:hypothetical protein
VAEWAARGSKLEKNCALCAKLANPANYPKGARVKIAGVYDCDNCPVMKAQPIPENENIIELYNALPVRYDPVTRTRIVTTADIKFIFNLYQIPENLQFDYYTRLMYFFRTMVINESKMVEKMAKEQQENAAWRKDRLYRLQPKSKITH